MQYVPPEHEGAVHRRAASFVLLMPYETWGRGRYANRYAQGIRRARTAARLRRRGARAAYVGVELEPSYFGARNGNGIPAFQSQPCMLTAAGSMAFNRIARILDELDAVVEEGRALVAKRRTI